MDQTPVLIAEKLLELVKRTYTPNDPQPSSFEAYEAKYQIEDLCGQLLRSSLGPLGYTALLAGEFSSPPLPGFRLTAMQESCQESSALGFVAQLGVADLLGNETMTVPEMSEALGVKTKYLSEYNTPHAL